jgi:hypothetical protein
MICKFRQNRMCFLLMQRFLYSKALHLGPWQTVRTLQDFAVSVLAAAVQLLGRVAQDLQQSPAFPELFQPAANALDGLAAVTTGHAVSNQQPECYLGRSYTVTTSAPSPASHTPPRSSIRLQVLQIFTPYGSQGLDGLRASALADIQAKLAAAVATRRPLARKPDKAAAVKLYNPRFEDDYVAGKDFDPDRC